MQRLRAPLGEVRRAPGDLLVEQEADVVQQGLAARLGVSPYYVQQVYATQGCTFSDPR